jgi:hypothetical protein
MKEITNGYTYHEEIDGGQKEMKVYAYKVPILDF